MTTKHEIIYILDDELGKLDERYKLEDSFCHFSSVHENRIYEDSIEVKMYGATLFMSWKLGSWEL